MGLLWIINDYNGSVDAYHISINTNFTTNLILI